MNFFCEQNSSCFFDLLALQPSETQKKVVADWSAACLHMWTTGWGIYQLFKKRNIPFDVRHIAIVKHIENPPDKHENYCGVFRTVGPPDRGTMIPIG